MCLYFICGTFNKVPQNSVHLHMEMMFNFMFLRLVYGQHIRVCLIVLSFVLCTTHSRDLIDPCIITHISMCTLWGGPILESICVVVPLFPDYILSSIERYLRRELYIS